MISLCLENASSWLSCRLCKSDARDLYPCGDPATGKVSIPQQLQALRNSFERGQVSMCGLFSSTLRKADPLKCIYIGEVNILPKLQRHYQGMYGFLVHGKNLAPQVKMTPWPGSKGLSGKGGDSIPVFFKCEDNSDKQ